MASGRDGADRVTDTTSAGGELAERPITALRGVGARMAERLQRLGIETVVDLLLHAPHRYEDRTRVRPIGGVRPGERVLVEGTVELAEIAQGRRSRLLCRIADGTGALDLVFFRFHPRQIDGLARGTRLQCFGEARPGLNGLQMAHPEYKRVHSGGVPDGGRLTPVYPTTEGLQQGALRSLMAQALEEAPSALPELLTAAELPDATWPSLAEALEGLHRPPPDADVDALTGGLAPVVRRIAWEELLAHHLTLRSRREATLAVANAPQLLAGEPLADALREALPFPLTAAQQRVERELADDLAREQPMLRLLQGDVGSGKTVVAALTALRAVGSGYQVAFMAPTELLAEQHYRTLQSWFAPLDIDIAWVAGGAGAAARRSAMETLESGAVPVAVGTHALFQDPVRFHRLGLVIVDEQHRFGVHQRLALREKGGGYNPHQLIMTATPIPRTLAMTAYADLDVSSIDERPPGRTPVKTAVLPEERRDEVVERIRAALDAQRQAYWVCTLIEASDELEAEAAEETATRLTEALHPHRVGLVHGRMPAVEKERIMGAFARGEVSLLVATTVIEVGVDVPDASLMVIENAERLGLSQLHQLRGRVGRGRAASSCLLLYHSPLSETARSRLAVLRETEDGFEIARRDLEIRGPGELLGTRQTGALTLRIADLHRDADLLEAIPATAGRLLTDDRARAERLIRRWVGSAARYGDV